MDDKTKSKDSQTKDNAGDLKGKKGGQQGSKDMDQYGSRDEDTDTEEEKE